LQPEVLNTAVVCADETTVRKHQDTHHNAYKKFASCICVNRNLY